MSSLLEIVRNSVTNARADDLVPLAGVPGNIIPWHFTRHQLSSFFPKTIIENGNFPYFCCCAEDSFTKQVCACVIKGNGSFDPIPGRTPGRFSPILFLSGCISLGHFSLISRVGPFCQTLVGLFGPLHFIQC